MDNVDVWNAAIEAFAQRLAKYYQQQKGFSHPAVVEYHIKQIANDLKRENPYDEIQ
jgi:hypothetical protein